MSHLTCPAETASIVHAIVGRLDQGEHPESIAAWCSSLDCLMEHGHHITLADLRTVVAWIASTMICDERLAAIVAVPAERLATAGWTAAAILAAIAGACCLCAAA